MATELSQTGVWDESDSAGDVNVVYWAEWWLRAFQWRWIKRERLEAMEIVGFGEDEHHVISQERGQRAFRVHDVGWKCAVSSGRSGILWKRDFLNPGGPDFRTKIWAEKSRVDVPVVSALWRSVADGGLSNSWVGVSRMSEKHWNGFP